MLAVGELTDAEVDTVLAVWLERMLWFNLSSYPAICMDAVDAVCYAGLFMLLDLFVQIPKLSIVRYGITSWFGM